MIKYEVTVEDNGTEIWRKHATGKINRVGGPAITYYDGTEMWYLDGKLHREAGPAIKSSDGTEMWYMNNVLHREDGPAVIVPGTPDSYSYWFDGKRYSKEGFEAEMKRRKAPAPCADKIVEIEGVKYRLVKA